MEASCIEIYNNQLRDLLAGPSAPYISDQNAIKHDPSGGHTTVVGVSRVSQEWYVCGVYVHGMVILIVDGSSPPSPR